MARLPQPGKDVGTWGIILNDFLNQSHNDDGSIKDNVVTPAALAGNIPQTKIANLQDDISSKANTSDLALVATSGLFVDLTDKPTIPSALSNLADDSTHRLVTDTEKGAWDGKQEAMGSDDNYITDAEKTDLHAPRSDDQDLTGKVDKNNAITGATKTKITYDANGLVTSGADATTADIADSTDKRYVLDTEKTAITHSNRSALDLVSGTNTGDNSTNSQYSGLAASKLNIADLGVDANILLLPSVTITSGSRVSSTGAILADANAFRTNAIPVMVGDRYASVSSSIGTLPHYAFYSSSTISSGTLVSIIGTRDATVPSGATYMVIYYSIIYQTGFAVQKLATGYPVFGVTTIIYNDLYTKTEVDTKVEVVNASIKQKLDISQIGVETNILISKDVTITSGSRVSSTGAILADAASFRTNAIPVTVGDRYASVSSNTGQLPAFAFYSSSTISSTSMVGSVIGARAAVVPAGATHMVFYALISLQSSYILTKLATGYPVLGQETFVYNDLYTKAEIDTALSVKLEEPNLTHWYPEAFELDIITIESNCKVLTIAADNTLYGTDGFNGIFKATEYDLSDATRLYLLNSGSSLQKLLFVSPTKAVGYVISFSTPEDTGFYCFDTTNPTTWIASRPTDTDVSNNIYRKMRVGAPAFEFQSLIKTPDSAYLFASSYNANKVLSGGDVTQAPIDVYRSSDLGETWGIVYTHSNPYNQHIHCIEWDIYRDRLWVCVGDDGAGGTAGLAYSDTYGDFGSFTFISSASGQTPFMDTAIIPTRRYVLFGTDMTPAGIIKWMPLVDEKNAIVSNTDVTNAYLIPVSVPQNFGFAKNPVVDISTYPYKIAMAVSHNASYSKSCILISPNYRDWYMMDFVDAPLATVSWSAFSGITSDGWVLGWCTLTSDNKQYYRRFKFPNWVEN